MFFLQKEKREKKGSPVTNRNGNPIAFGFTKRNCVRNCLGFFQEKKTVREKKDKRKMTKRMDEKLFFVDTTKKIFFDSQKNKTVSLFQQSFLVF